MPFRENELSMAQHRPRSKRIGAAVAGKGMMKYPGRVLRTVGALISYRSALGKRPIHFLHIGKTAGTEIKRYIEHFNKRLDKRVIVAHKHDVSLREIPERDAYFFSIRDPIARFRSAFYSRKRKGQPLIYSEWSKDEAIAFRDFAEANDLAEALFREDILGKKAFAAIKSIRHTAQNQVDWFSRCGNFLELRPPLAIIRQEYFASDMQLLQSNLNLPAGFALEQDFVKSHKNDYSGTSELSELALVNLRLWYKQDLEFYRMCEEWLTNMRLRQPA